MKRVAASIIVALLIVGPLASVAAAGGGNSWSSLKPAGHEWHVDTDGKRQH